MTRDGRPLAGKRVLVTRSQEQSGKLVALLREAGAEPIVLPTIEVRPAEDFAPVDEAIANLASLAWVVFTSVNSARFFFQRLREIGLAPEALAGVKVAAIGSTTAEYLKSQGRPADLLPSRSSSRGLLEAFQAQNLAGCQVLLPRSDLADDALPGGLRLLGAQVHEVVAYRTLPASDIARKLGEVLKKGKVEAAIFMSPSTVRNLMAHMSGPAALEEACVVCIGPATAQEAQRLGLKVAIIPSDHSVPGLVAALAQAFGVMER